MKHRSGEKEDSKKSFQKGNINFDLLQPEREAAQDSGKTEPDKRGIFFKSRNLRPIGLPHILAWLCLLFVSAFTIAWSLIKGKSFIWLLILPMVFLFFLWSLIMILMLLARPR